MDSARRLAEYRAVNTEDETVLNYFDELEFHPEMIGSSIFLINLTLIRSYKSFPFRLLNKSVPRCRSYFNSMIVYKTIYVHNIYIRLIVRFICHLCHVSFEDTATNLIEFKQIGTAVYLFML